MDTTYGPAAPALSGLTKVIREYSLFQAVLLVIDRLREAHPHLSEDDLYDQLEFQANPSLGFPGSDVDRVEFFEEHGVAFGERSEAKRERQGAMHVVTFFYDPGAPCRWSKGARMPLPYRGSRCSR